MDASIRQIAAAELLERARYFALKPQRVLLLGNQPDATPDALLQHFPRADLLSLHASASASRSGGSGGWWTKRQPLHGIRANAIALPLKAKTADLTFIGLLLPAFTQPEQVLREVVRVMRPGALLLLSSLGPGSLPELSMPVGGYPDLPQLGDLLLASGFAEPVMDIERHLITYASAAGLCEALRQLSIDPACADVAARTLTFELIVAAAFAPSAPSRPADVTRAASAGEIAIPLSSVRPRKHEDH